MDENKPKRRKRKNAGRPVVLKNSSRFVREKLHGKAYLVPSFVTVVGIFCGFLAIVSAFKGNFVYASRCILIAVVLDGLDGRIARRLNATSPFGREFDSLSDVVSFGVAPAVLVYCWAFVRTADEFGVLVVFLFLVCGATRLARFNVAATEEEVKSGFTGMPIPGAAAAIVSVVFCFPEPVHNQMLIAGIMLYMVFIGVLMVSTLPFFSVKKLQLSEGDPRVNLILLAAAVALTWKYPERVVFVISTAYAFSGVVGYTLRKLRPKSEASSDAKSA